ncbi:hypothetical protein E4U52_000587, partial [Claviceps spartinae]
QSRRCRRSRPYSAHQRPRHGLLGLGELVQGLIDIGDSDRAELHHFLTTMRALREDLEQPRRDDGCVADMFDDMVGLSPALAGDEVVVKVFDHVAEDTLTAAVDVQVETAYRDQARLQSSSKASDYGLRQRLRISRCDGEDVDDALLSEAPSMASKRGNPAGPSVSFTRPPPVPAVISRDIRNKELMHEAHLSRRSGSGEPEVCCGSNQGSSQSPSAEK